MLPPWQFYIKNILWDFEPFSLRQTAMRKGRWVFLEKGMPSEFEKISLKI